MLTRLDDGLIDHEKVEQAGVQLGKFGYERALGAATWAIVFANRRLTDGYLPQRALEKYRITKQTADALVSVGLWDAVDDGYQIHHFHDWNPTAAEVKAKQSRDRERKRRAAGFQTDSARNPDGIQTDSACYTRAPAVTGLDGIGKDVEAGKEPDLVASRFETFWDAYPRKDAKKDAEKAFRRLKPSHNVLAAMLDAIVAQGLAKREKRFVPLPGSWLNGERWMDEVVGPKLVAPAPEWKAHCPHGTCVTVTQCPEAWAWVKAQTAVSA